MRRAEAVRILAGHQQELRDHFGVTSVRLFGSVARDEASEGSDVDVLVDFHDTPSLFGFLSISGNSSEQRSTWLLNLV